MKKKIFIVVSILFLLSFLFIDNDQPKPEHPITITAVPRSTIKVTGNWKRGEFLIGYRIITDNYIITSGYAGIFGQQGGVARGPGIVKHPIMSSFGQVFELAEEMKNKELITFHGDLYYVGEESHPYIFEGRKVIILYNAIHNDQNYEVNRRPWDNQ